MKEINRLNDLFVRYLIGKEGDEDILENIVNAVLNDAGLESVNNLEIINPYNLPENENLKESILDVKAKTKDGKKILIEIQLVGNNNFIKRILYYIAKNIASELKESDLYINISQMISISFINFNLDIGSETDIKKEHKCFILFIYKKLARFYHLVHKFFIFLQIFIIPLLDWTIFRYIL